jgi:hypothetical protein
VLVTLGLLILAAVAICRLLRSEWDRSLSLVAVAVGAGWLLLALPGVDALIRSGGQPIVEGTRQVAFAAGPFLLLAGACWGLVRLARRCWASWPDLEPAWRGAGVVGCVAAGLVVAVLVHAVPGVAEAARVAEQAAGAGLRAGREALWVAVLEVLGGGNSGA